MKLYYPMLAAFILIIALASCSTSPKVVFFTEIPPRTTTFELNRLEFEGRYSTSEMKSELRSLQVSAAALAGLKLTDSGNRIGSYYVDVFYRDVELIKKFRRFHSLGVILTIFNSEGEMVAKVYKSEESDETLESMTTTLKFTKEIWASLARKLPKE